MTAYPHLFSRIFGSPLLIERGKLEAILSAIGPRLGIEAETVVASGPGDTGRQRKEYYVTDDKIAVIDVMGPLVKRNSGEFLSGGPTTYSQIENEFSEAVSDYSIQGILLVVDSPGGESTGAFELSDLIYNQRSKKPIVAVADGDAFSAAYAIASAADQVFVAKSGGVGSVGVWMMHMDRSEANAQKGIKPTYLFAGARKIDGNPDMPLSNDARKTFQALVDRTYGMFVETVARNRGIDPRAVKRTEAGLFFGEDGVEVGFADRVGTMSDAMTYLREKMSGNSTTRAASTASNANHKEVLMPPKEEVQAAESTAPKETPAPEILGAELVGKEEAERTESRVRAAIDYAAEVADLCSLAGMARKASGFIRANKPIADVRSELQDARAAEDAAAMIHSHVLPETNAASDGTANTKTEDSPIVKAAMRLARAGKEK